MGLLDQIFASNTEDPRYAANMALFGNMVKGDFGGGLLAASTAGAQAKTAQQEAQYKQMQMQQMQAEAQARQIKAQQEQAAMGRQRAIQQAMPSLFGMQGGAPQGSPQQMPQGAPQQMPQPEAMETAQAPTQQGGGFDARRAALLGMDPDLIQKYVGLQNAGRQEVARTVNVPGPNGEKMVLQIDKFGQPVGKPMTEFEAAQMVQLGDRQTAVVPRAGMSLPMGMSPEARDSSARGWAGLNETKRHNNVSESNAAATANAGRIPAGYRVKPDGSMEAIPGGPADLKAGAEGQKKVGDAKDVLGLLDEVDKLIPKATGSLAGAGVDQAARFFGASTSGAEATAQLKTLQGALIGKMPKMSGPQSDKDVQLYREMAGQVADPTIPRSTRQAAADTIRSLNEKYAGMQEGSSKAAASSLVQSLPKMAAKGTRARDTTTGDILEFNGMSWVKAK